MNIELPVEYYRHIDDFAQYMSIFLECSAMIHPATRFTRPTSWYKMHPQTTSAPPLSFTVLWAHQVNILYPSCLLTNTIKSENGGIMTNH